MSYDFEDLIKKGGLSDEENERIYSQKGLFEYYAKNTSPQEQPTVVIVGGQPGAGKSTIVTRFKQTFEHSGVVHIDSDELRPYHPLQKEQDAINDRLTAVYTGKDAGIWAQKLMNDAVVRRLNIIFESPLKNTEKILQQIDMLAGNGYYVGLKMAIVPYDLSLLGAYSRYEKPKAKGGYGRFVHDKPLRDSYQNQAVTVEAIKRQGKVNSIEIYSREGIIFKDDYRQADLNKMITAEQCRQFTLEEAAKLKNRWREVGQMMIDRGANEREFLRIEKQLTDRLTECINKGYPEENIQLLTNIKNDFSKQFRQSFP
jgi:predicted ABC-type ATPase